MFVSWDGSDCCIVSCIIIMYYSSIILGILFGYVMKFINLQSTEPGGNSAWNFFNFYADNT